MTPGYTLRSLGVQAGLVALLVLLTGLVAGAFAQDARAEGEEGPTWRLEPVLPPTETGVPPSSTPIGLGRIGDIEFRAPNRGLVITAGNPPTIPPGVWTYDGVSWHELSNQCGATDGRIAWAGPEEFWTVSDGRPGQVESEGAKPPLEDNTLCHFAGGAIVGSYGSLAFRPDSYQPMHGAGCLSPADCWFAGEVLPSGQVGSFHLHWDGGAVSAVPNPQGRAVEDLRRFGTRLFESVRITPGDLISPPESALEPSPLHTIAPKGIAPTFVSLRPESPTGQSLPVYFPEEFPSALDFLHIGSDEEELWGAANPVAPPPEGSAPGEVTILRESGGEWSQLLGPTTDPPEGNPFTKFFTPERERENLLVRGIAAYPGSQSAWLALDTKADVERPSPVARALVARISADGTISEQQALPSAAEEAAGIGPKGAAERISCPAAGDCWLATTQGWLFHLSTAAQRHLPQDTDPPFSSLISFRPKDLGVPETLPDAPPVDDSGLPGESPAANGPLETVGGQKEAQTPVALLSHIRSRLVHGTTLELRFHLAVRARLRLIAKRRGRTVASTPMLTLAAGNRRLMLRLNRGRWPTKLSLQSRALAPLPTVSTRNPEVGAVSTRLRAPLTLPATGASGSLP